MSEMSESTRSTDGQGNDQRGSDRRSLAAIVLCGGESRRMGRSKASLPFGDRTMLQCVIDRLDHVCDPIVLVAASDQSLPPVHRQHGDLHVARDERPQRGPLEGLIAGMRRLRQCGAGDGQSADDGIAFATSCDVPMLRSEWPRQLVSHLKDAKIAVPFDQQHHHPLAAIYRLAVLCDLERLSERDELRPRKLFDLVETARVPVEQMTRIDPLLDTLANLNTPDDYLTALQRAGLPCSAELRASFASARDDAPLH